MTYTDQPLGAERVYTRALPGGGYVAIEIDGSSREREVPCSRVWVERRASLERQVNHPPVVIAEAECDEESPAFAELYQIAADNAAIARRLLAMETARRDD